MPDPSSGQGQQDPNATQLPTDPNATQLPANVGAQPSAGRRNSLLGGQFAEVAAQMKEQNRLSKLKDLRRRLKQKALDSQSTYKLYCLAFLTFALPPALHYWLLSIVGFSMHRSSEVGMWGLVGVIALCYLIYVVVMVQSWRLSIPVAQAHRKWHIALNILLPVALIWGTIAGDDIYFEHMEPYYVMNDLAKYVNVNPAKERGQSYMDSGQVYFKEGSRVSTADARAFQDRHIYCVAPIVGQPLSTAGGASELFQLPPSGTIDFWAVGIDCCLPSGEQYKCHDVGNGSARSGFRLLRDDQRVFFKMAVQEWSAEYNLPVRHPLFFYWVQDPVADTGAYQLQGGTQKWVSWGSFLVFHVVVFYLCWFFGAMEDKRLAKEALLRKEGASGYGSMAGSPV